MNEPSIDMLGNNRGIAPAQGESRTANGTRNAANEWARQRTRVMLKCKEDIRLFNRNTICINGYINRFLHN